MSRLGVLTGMAREAVVIERAAARAGVALDVGLGGTDPARTRAQAKRLAGAAPDLLVSFGLAGGLVPAYRPGTLILPDAVVDDAGGRWPMSAGWHGALLDRQPEAGHVDAVVGVDAPVATARAKHVLATATGAAAVDMESVALAQAAAERGVPMVVVRAVCDPAERAIPEVVQTLLDARGRVRWRRLPALVPNLPGVLRLAADSTRATRSLRRGAAALVQLAEARGRPIAS